MDTSEPTFLLIDDNRDNLTSLRAVLSDALPGCALATALDGPQGIALARAKDPDVILLDIIMPGMDGFEVCRRLKAEECVRDIPVIFLTALGTDRASRIKALAVGGDGFLTKPPDEQELVAQLRAMVKVKAVNRLQQLERQELTAQVAARTRELEAELAERSRVEEKLLQQTAVTASINRVLQGALQADTVAEVARICLSEAEALTGSRFGWIGEVNSSGRLDTVALSDPGWEACRMPEGSAIALQDMTIRGLFGVVLKTGRSLLTNAPDAHPDRMGLPPGHPKLTAVLSVPLAQNERTVGVLTLGNKPGGYAQEDLKALEVLSVACAAALQRKHAEASREQLQEQLRVSQKLEAIGSLAGGVAHDFNNLLTVILANTTFALESLTGDDAVRDDLSQVMDAAERAASLTRQLLAFSRKQVLQPVPLDLNQAVAGIDKMLRRLIGEDIELVLDLAPDIGLTLADPAQIGQVLMNLAVNARDAMPEGGKLTISTAIAELDEHAARRIGTEPGINVLLTVTDTGCGMNEDTLKRVFDPFFTTKVDGKGTGLGLSTVYGIVKQSSGHVRGRSKLGKGTTFELYLRPMPPAAAKTVTGSVRASACSSGNETILVVEDEPALRKVASRTLEAAGYTVLIAADGEEARRVMAEHAGEIHLLLTDVIMPRMSGSALAQELSKAYPALKVLYMSGYTDNAIARHGVLDAGTEFLAKPFSLSELARKVREVLDGDG